jgi:hypothetical protein
MSKKDSQFLQDIRDFDQKLLKYVQSYMLPAFKGMKFSSPKCDYDIDDEGTASVNGIIYDNANDSTFHYTIALYPADDKVRVSITKFHQGNLCHIADTDFWKINEDNISSKGIKDKFLTLTEMEQKYYKKHYGE